jgi:hypothetical protein
MHQHDAAADEDVVAAWLGALGNAEVDDSDDDDSDEEDISRRAESDNPSDDDEPDEDHQRHKIPTCQNCQKRMKKTTHRRTTSTFSTSVMCERTSFHWSFSWSLGT